MLVGIQILIFHSWLHWGSPFLLVVGELTPTRSRMTINFGFCWQRIQRRQVSVLIVITQWIYEVMCTIMLMTIDCTIDES